MINYNPDLIQRKIGVRESFESKCTVASNKFWSSMSFQNLVRLSHIKKFPLPDYTHVNKVSKKSENNDN
jgi:hypothetical protein